jgi:phage portal protein BeeE
MASVVSKWFSKKQTQTKKRYRPEGRQVVFQSLVQTPGKPVWTPREYQKFADEAYTRNVITHRAMGLVAQGAAGVPWLLYNGKGEARQEVKNHPVLSLLKNPNPHMNGSQFIENLITYRLISGNAYVLAIGPTGGAPMELHLLRPDRVQVIAGRIATV